MEKSHKVEKKVRELETHHNQRLTDGARNRGGSSPGDGSRRKVVVLNLNELEEKALEYLGGVPALKALLCPSGVCIKCRKRAAKGAGTLSKAYCEGCSEVEQV